MAAAHDGEHGPVGGDDSGQSAAGGLCAPILARLMQAQVWAGQTNSVPTPVDRLLSCRRSTIYDDTVQIQIQIRLYLYLDDAGMRTDALTLQHKTVGLLRNNNNNPSRSCDPEVSRAPTLRPT